MTANFFIAFFALLGITMMIFSFYRMHQVEVNFEDTMRAGAPWYERK